MYIRSLACIRSLHKSVLIVQEYASGGDLFEYLTSHGAVTNEQLAKSIFKDLCLALMHMHDVVGACHRDVKPVCLRKPQALDGHLRGNSMCCHPLF